MLFHDIQSPYQSRWLLMLRVSFFQPVRMSGERIVKSSP